jgi:hypothetical protein
LTPAIYRHIGGAVVADHGPIPLAAARDLVRFYALEAEACLTAGPEPMARLYAHRALTLRAAVETATQWRRAAGWRDPDAADLQHP